MTTNFSTCGSLKKINTTNPSTSAQSNRLDLVELRYHLAVLEVGPTVMTGLAVCK